VCLKAINHNGNSLISIQFHENTFGYLAFVCKYSILNWFVAFKAVIAVKYYTQQEL
jgi:hypothetical protein